MKNNENKFFSESFMSVTKFIEEAHKQINVKVDELFSDKGAYYPKAGVFRLWARNILQQAFDCGRSFEKAKRENPEEPSAESKSSSYEAEFPEDSPSIPKMVKLRGLAGLEEYWVWPEQVVLHCPSLTNGSYVDCLTQVHRCPLSGTLEEVKTEVEKVRAYNESLKK